jgi:hypothetical protein
LEGKLETITFAAWLITKNLNGYETSKSIRTYNDVADVLAVSKCPERAYKE